MSNIPQLLEELAKEWADKEKEYENRLDYLEEQLHKEKERNRKLKLNLLTSLTSDLNENGEYYS